MRPANDYGRRVIATPARHRTPPASASGDSDSTSQPRSTASGGRAG
jgi:hypothetical protein